MLTFMFKRIVLGIIQQLTQLQTKLKPKTELNAAS